MTPDAWADLLLHEWACWSREDVIRCGWPHATSFGKAIKPDPAPAREPINDLRAQYTDAVVARLPGRMRYLVKVAYLDPSPIPSKARKLRCTEYAYRKRLTALRAAVYLALETHMARVYKHRSLPSVPAATNLPP
jgi:hypothetical protein